MRCAHKQKNQQLSSYVQLGPYNEAASIQQRSQPRQCAAISRCGMQCSIVPDRLFRVRYRRTRQAKLPSVLTERSQDVSRVSAGSRVASAQQPAAHAVPRSRWQARRRGHQNARGGSLPCISRPAVDAAALDAAEPGTADVPAADNGTVPQPSGNGAYQNGSNGAHAAQTIIQQPQQSPATSLPAFAVAVYRFSRPHTIFGTFISVCSVSALALVSICARPLILDRCLMWIATVSSCL